MANEKTRWGSCYCNGQAARIYQSSDIHITHVYLFACIHIQKYSSVSFISVQGTFLHMYTLKEKWITDAVLINLILIMDISFRTLKLVSPTISHEMCLCSCQVKVCKITVQSMEWISVMMTEKWSSASGVKECICNCLCSAESSSFRQHKWGQF